MLLALVPIVAQPFLSISVDAFDNLSLGAGAGSLLGVLALVAVPVLMLGAVSPWAIRLKLEAIEDSGQTAGRMYAISTVGSLLGTFLAALLLIPVARHAADVPDLRARACDRGRARVAAPLVARAGSASPRCSRSRSAPSRRPTRGACIHETETEYQYARVIQRPNGERTLELNEGQAIHSLYRPHSVLTGGYWDDQLVTPYTVRPEPPRRVAILGFAGGTTARAFARYHPDTLIDGVEIDGELFDIARRYFGLEPRPQLKEHAEDARPFLRHTTARYDAIFVDAYRQPYIPFYLATREFFELARDRLTPDGIVVLNVGHPRTNDQLEKVLTATMGAAFRHVARDPVQPTNTLLLASQRPISRDALLDAARTLPGVLRPLALQTAARLEGPLRGGDVYTDDKAPVEWLIDKSIVEYAAGDE